MTVDVGDILRVAVTGTSPQASVFQNVWHYSATSGTGGNPDVVLAGLAAQHAIAWADMGARISDEYTWTLYEMWKRDIINQRWDGISVLDVSDFAGSSVNDPVAHGVAAVGRVVTNSFRRQGRHFLPGVTELQIVDGLFQAAALTDMADYMSDFAETEIAGGITLDWCTYNTTPGSPVFQTESLATNTVIANEIPGYQRRRKPLVGI